MRLVYFGSGAFGIPTLDALARTHEVALIVTQPDRPAGRGDRLTPTPVAQWAAEHRPGVPVIKPERVNNPQVVTQIRGAAAPAWVVIAFGQKLGRALLEGVFAINLHASLLPRWRGAAPINAAILAGDAETGNSVITLADRMDAGLVLGQSRRVLDAELTAGELHEALAGDGPDLVRNVLRAHETGTLALHAQDEALVTIAPKLSKTDGWVDFAQPAEQCRRRIHGLTPWPGVAVGYRGQPLKLLRCRVDPVTSEPTVIPGTLMNADRGLVACGSGTAVALLEVQAPGKRALSWSDYARGQRPSPHAGDVLRGRDGDRG